ncbi:MAG: amidase [Proteobacteria bacterium]|nr:amidase [Pseudomonadota bacterium]
MKNWHDESATELVKAIKKGNLSAESLMESTLKRIGAINPSLNAIISNDFENALIKAKEADKQRDRKENLGLLHGIPVTIKDNLEVMGMPCTAAAKDFQQHMPNRNADVVDALLQEGAIVIGKTNLPKLADDFQTYNDLFGKTTNPWDQSKTPGGSSGGAAAAVAAGLSVLDIGNDVGGSIRIPAHFCGIYGHKPTYGIVPDRGMVPPAPGIFAGDFSFNMDIVTNGPLARSPEDLELIMKIIAQPKANDRKAWQLSLPESKKNKLNDFKIGIWADDEACPVDKSIVDAIHRVADELSNEGVIVEESKPNLDFNRCFNLFSSLLNAVLGQATPHKIFKKWIEKESELDHSNSGYKNKQMIGAIQRHRDWLMRDAERQIFRQKWSEFFQEYDLLLCPAVCTNAIAHDHSPWFDRTIQINNKAYPYSNLMGWPGLTNSVYLPSTVVPIGISNDGLPIGMQIVGDYLEDMTCIHFAMVLKEKIGGFTPPDLD